LRASSAAAAKMCALGSAFGSLVFGCGSLGVTGPLAKTLKDIMCLPWGTHVAVLHCRMVSFVAVLGAWGRIACSEMSDVLCMAQRHVTWCIDSMARYLLCLAASLCKIIQQADTQGRKKCAQPT
jgi:hypothetical protein